MNLSCKTPRRHVASDIQPSCGLRLGVLGLCCILSHHSSRKGPPCARRRRRIRRALPEGRLRAVPRPPPRGPTPKAGPPPRPPAKPAAAKPRAARKLPGWLARAQRLLLQPTQEWATIAGEFTSAGPLYRRYLVPMAAIGP